MTGNDQPRAIHDARELAARNGTPAGPVDADARAVLHSPALPAAAGVVTSRVVRDRLWREPVGPLPALAVFLLGSAATLLVWGLWRDRSETEAAAATLDSAHRVARVVEEGMAGRIAELGQLASFWARAELADPATWKADAARTMEAKKGLVLLAWLERPGSGTPDAPAGPAREQQQPGEEGDEGERGDESEQDDESGRGGQGAQDASRGDEPSGSGATGSHEPDGVGEDGAGEDGSDADGEGRGAAVDPASEPRDEAPGDGRQDLRGVAPDPDADERVRHPIGPRLLPDPRDLELWPHPRALCTGRWLVRAAGAAAHVGLSAAVPALLDPRPTQIARHPAGDGDPEALARRPAVQSATAPQQPDETGAPDPGPQEMGEPLSRTQQQEPAPRQTGEAGAGAQQPRQPAADGAGGAGGAAGADDAGGADGADGADPADGAAGAGGTALDAWIRSARPAGNGDGAGGQRYVAGPGELVSWLTEQAPPALVALCRTAQEHGVTTVSEPLAVGDGRSVVAVGIPLAPREGRALLLALIEPQALLQRLLAGVAVDHGLRIRDGERELFQRGAIGPPEAARPPWALSAHPVESSLGRPWLLDVARGEAPLARRVATAILGAGIAVSVLLGCVVHLGQVARARARATELATRELRDRVHEARVAAEQVRSLNRTLEERVAERTEVLEEAVDELEMFNQSVSHDLRSPLGAVLNYVAILDEDYAEPLGREGREMLRRIERCARVSVTLMDELLAFSRVRGQRVELAPVDMRHLCRAVFAELCVNHAGPRPELVVGDLPRVRADAGLIRLVWINLLGNAIKFTRDRPAPRIEVGARQAGGEAIYYVRDNGVGFEMDASSRLFRVFERLHPREAYEGHGIGLATVRRIVHRHGGRVWAKGEPDRGAIFFFSIPDAEASHGRTA